MLGIPTALLVKIGIGAGAVAVLVAGYLWIRADAREEGRQEIRDEVAAVVKGQQDRVKDATIKQLEQLHESQSKALEIARDALAKVTAECAVDPAIIDAFDRLRSGGLQPQ